VSTVPSDLDDAPPPRQSKSEYMRALAFKRHAQAKAGVEHALFPTAEGERIPDIQWIQVRRIEPGRGPVDAGRIFPADEIRSQEDLHLLFGGGVYELWGRAAASSGGPGIKLKTERITLDGESIPFSGVEAVEAPPAPGANGHYDPMTAMMQQLAEDRRESRAQDQRRQEREEARSAQNMQLFMQGITALTGVVTAMISRPQPAPQDVSGLLTAAASMASSQVNALIAVLPKPQQGDSLDQLSRVLDVAKKVQGKEENTETLADVMQGFGAAAAGIAQLEATRPGSGNPLMAPQPTQEQQQHQEPPPMQQQNLAPPQVATLES
jgi:hypothetical protein